MQKLVWFLHNAKVMKFVWYLENAKGAKVVCELLHFLYVSSFFYSELRKCEKKKNFRKLLPLLHLLHFLSTLFYLVRSVFSTNHPS